MPRQFVPSQQQCMQFIRFMPKQYLALGIVGLLMLGCRAQPRGAIALTPPHYVLVNAREDGFVLFIGQEMQRCSCSLAHVDGFNNSLDEARANFATISQAYQSSGGQCQIFGFAWKSDVGLLSLQRAEREVDARIGAAFTAALDRIEARCPSAPLHVTSHSLGARVVLRALAERVQSGKPPIAVAALAASAVPTTLLLPGGELALGLRGARRMVLVHNSEDYILGFFYPLFAQGKPPLGQFGLRSYTTAVRRELQQHGTELIDLDMARLWGSHHSAVLSFDERFWALFIKHIASQRG